MRANGALVCLSGLVRIDPLPWHAERTSEADGAGGSNTVPGQQFKSGNHINPPPSGSWTARRRSISRLCVSIGSHTIAAGLVARGRSIRRPRNIQPSRNRIAAAPRCSELLERLFKCHTAVRQFTENACYQIRSAAE